MASSSAHSDRAFVCADVTKKTSPLPETLNRLLSSTEIHSEQEALCIVLHALSLEIGLIPIGISLASVNECMPADWIKSACYSVSYYHPSCPEQVCVWVAVPMGPLFLIHGHVESSLNATPSSKCTHKANVFHFVQRDNHSLESKKYSFCKLDVLSRGFKDEILYTLLANAQHRANVMPTFGITTLCTELKVQILEKLNVRAVLAMSRVNKEFHELTNTPSLWKLLYCKDFNKQEVLEMIKNGNWQLGVGNWKAVYINAYRRKKAQNRPPQRHYYSNFSFLYSDDSPYYDPLDPFCERFFWVRPDPHFQVRSFTKSYTIPWTEDDRHAY